MTIGNRDNEISRLPSAMHISNIHPKIMEGEGCNPGKCICTVFKDKRVCKNYFLKNFYISNKRFSNVVKKIPWSVSENGNGGDMNLLIKHPDSRHVSKKDILFPIQTVVTQGHKNPNEKYLDARLRIMKLYELYMEKFSVKGKVPMKESYYEMIFNICLNPVFIDPPLIIYTTFDNSEKEMKTCDLDQGEIRAHDSVPCKKSSSCKSY